MVANIWLVTGGAVSKQPSKCGRYLALGTTRSHHGRCFCHLVMIIFLCLSKYLYGHRVHRAHLELPNSLFHFILYISWIIITTADMHRVTQYAVSL